jgi:hypothetical protein
MFKTPFFKLIFAEKETAFVFPFAVEFPFTVNGNTLFVVFVTEVVL